MTLPSTRLVVLWLAWALLLASPASAVAVPAPLAVPRAADGSPSVISPVEPMRVVALARIPRPDWKPGRRGVDLAAAVGDPVRSPAAGIVTFAGVVVDRPVLSITHHDGTISSLEPVVASVTVGARVSPGQSVGQVADTPGHCMPAACLHWGVRIGGQYVDPLDVLEGYGPVRLLPRERGAWVSRRRPFAAATHATS
ncbi:peptidoglycan DD-metalloendopeptidase family protein [Demequina sp.]|uniref:peptidoglycan DD-metalloendopeptidase family protein n=1 Tax=Demequina sp. TaxID=2050685 RepID=UPI003A85C9F0